MRCKFVRQTLSEARYQGGKYPPEVAEHLESCQGCGNFARASQRLDELLALDQPIAAGPGFDTRFFARLADLKESERQSARVNPFSLGAWLRQWRWALGGISLACAMVMALVFRPSHQPSAVSTQVAPLSEQDLALARDLELIEDLDLVRRLKEVETFETLAQLDLADIERARSGSTNRAHSDKGVVR